MMESLRRTLIFQFDRQPAIVLSWALGLVGGLLPLAVVFSGGVPDREFGPLRHARAMQGYTVLQLPGRDCAPGERPQNLAAPQAFRTEEFRPRLDRE